MSKENEIALQKSIKKWEDVVATGADGSSWKDCALCHLYFARLHCAGCPVRAHTGKSTCAGTPYDEYREALVMGYPRNEKLAIAAQKEVDFLKMLLEKEKEKGKET